MSVTVLAFDYRGYGKSDGTPTVPGVLQDARSARKFLATKAAIPESEIVLMGESLGGAIAVDLAHGARGLVLESTFSSFKDVAEHHSPNFFWLIPERKLNSVKTIANYRGPLFQSHGDADRIIPIDLGRKLHAAAPGTKEFYRLHHADHNYLAPTPTTNPSTASWAHCRNASDPASQAPTGTQLPARLCLACERRTTSEPRP